MSSALLRKQCSSGAAVPRNSRQYTSITRQPLKVVAYREAQESQVVAAPRSGFQAVVDLLLQRAASRLDRGAATCLTCKGQGMCSCQACKGKGIGEVRSLRPSLMARKLQEVKEMLGGDHIEFDWHVTNRCPVCQGSGMCQCSACRGTGQRVPFAAEKVLAGQGVRH